MNRRIRLGMVGGGRGAFIGGVHRIAARIDGDYELVAGALSSDPERARDSAADLGISPDRAYADFAAMAQGEAARADGIEAVAIVTPNHLHFAPVKAFLEAGIHVICDKPVTATLDDALALAGIVQASGKLFVLTHNYTGYPMLREARARIAAGEIGALRTVQVEYAQDWLAAPAERDGNKQAEWRTDPARSGGGGALGDIGTHAWNLAAFVTGQTPDTLLADTSAFGPGRTLDDDARLLLRYPGGARGMLWASQIAVGNANELSLRVYGETGGIEWSHREPNSLWVSPLGEHRRLVMRGGAGSGPEAARVTRVPGGHPEGYLEGFATIYAEAARAIRAARDGSELDPAVTFPTIADGVSGLRFIAAAVASAQAGSIWTKI